MVDEHLPSEPRHCLLYDTKIGAARDDGHEDHRCLRPVSAADDFETGHCRCHSVLALN